jgi:uncharacterized membrane protein YgcG
MRVARILTVLALAVGPVALTAAPAAAGVDDFPIESFTADYYLERDEDGRSTLKTVEKIVAVFPQYNMNRGIYRLLVRDYQGQPTNLHIESITDENGKKYQWESEVDGVFLNVRIGDPDVYVNGRTTYVITYTQYNVTLFDGDKQEFYWDTNGTGWPQYFGKVTARYHLSDELREALNGEVACYEGRQGSGDRCELVETDDGFEVVVPKLNPYENVTVAIGFEPGTFVPRDNSATATPVFFVQLVVTALALFLGVQALIRRRTVFADEPGRPTIVAEYLPPKGVSVLEAALVYRRRKKAVAAQLISMAVEHNIRVIEEERWGLGSNKQYTLQYLSSDGLGSDEQALLRAFFGHTLSHGETYRISKTDESVGKATYALIQRISKELVDRGWRKPVPAGKRVLPLLAASAAMAASFTCMIIMLDDARGGLLPVILFAVALLVEFLTIAVVSRMPLSARGAELRDHLHGLLLYIKVAETDRIRILQSPQGAERTPVNTSDRYVMLRLYERVLPYAVLFNEEKRWAKELGEYYDQEPPDWYSGAGAFTGAAFASSVNSLSSAASVAYSGTSSSSGGSSGGGSSGGGGGGGGGGGW